ncbi:hypothetical protein TWF173_005493 [Orbilia oligospora]|nr:hypothetical protein TWF173_005493 [Orbilia oligospora]
MQSLKEYSLSNDRHLWFDEETQYPDTMLSIVNYSFTDPLIEFVKSATFRLRAEEGYWLELTDTDNQIITKQLEELRGHLIHKADTKGAPKIRPVPKFSSDMDTDETVDSSADGYLNNLSEGSMESEYKIPIPSQARIEDALARTVRQVIQQDYTGYQPLDHQVSGFETGINYNPPGVNPSIENEDPLLMRELYLWLNKTPVGQCEPLVSLLSRAIGIRHLEINIFPAVQFVGHSELASIAAFDSFVKIFYAQMETLEALTVRISWVNGPQLQIPSLRKFDNLRRVHLFYGWDTHNTFTECMKDGRSYFQFMFPQQLEHLRIDMFKARPGLEFATFATQVPSTLFPNLRIVLGFAKEKIPEDITQAIGDLWASLPYLEDTVSGEWGVDGQKEPGSTSWRKSDIKCVPIKILAHGPRYRDVFCIDEGWNGPFQKHYSVDVAYSSNSPQIEL